MTESASADFHELRQGFIPPKPKPAETPPAPNPALEDVQGLEV
ncbi:MAG: hypothetical protein ABIU06_17010 [Anaerolineales bacterium]